MSMTAHRIDMSVKVVLAICVAYLTLPGVGDIAAAVERRVHPVVDSFQFVASTVTPERFCWVQKFQKFRLRTVTAWEFKLEAASGTSGPFLPVRLDGTTLDSPTNKPVGENRVGFCVTLPAYVKPGERFTITGYLAYEGMLDLWTLKYPLPALSAVRPVAPDG